ncbi:hypothetical protein [Zoogloea sp. LCSB751]|uniref:hypothetical protein n=1 Tax=Zoogloea sp. LCSB751 TaxID=1965277 RepID=UPI0009A5535A|nr:hypothetical protein [Zoogloea sp. LCSB751]
MRFGGRPSTLFRSVLALLLVCAQVFAAAHALSHVGELAGLARDESSSASAPFEGGVPAAERHERCLLCLAAADLASALPSVPPSPLPLALPPAPLADSPVAGRVARLPRPHSRGPPLSPA